MKTYHQFHDGFLDGFYIVGDTVQVFLRTVEKEKFVIICQGVTALTAEGFKGGNIILDVTTCDSSEITPEDVEELFSLRNDIEGNNQRDRELNNAREHDLMLLEINPSYGGNILMLVRCVEVYKKD